MCVLLPAASVCFLLPAACGRVYLRVRLRVRRGGAGKEAIARLRVELPKALPSVYELTDTSLDLQGTMVEKMGKLSSAEFECVCPPPPPGVSSTHAQRPPIALDCMHWLRPLLLSSPTALRVYVCVCACVPPRRVLHPVFEEDEWTLILVGGALGAIAGAAQAACGV